MSVHLDHDGYKDIIILSAGYIYKNGVSISTPVLTPFREKIFTIGDYISRGLKVYEITSDNRKVKLNLYNYDKCHELNESQPFKVEISKLGSKDYLV